MQYQGLPTGLPGHHPFPSANSKYDIYLLQLFQTTNTKFSSVSTKFNFKINRNRDITYIVC